MQICLHVSLLSDPGRRGAGFGKLVAGQPGNLADSATLEQAVAIAPGRMAGTESGRSIDSPTNRN